MQVYLKVKIKSLAAEAKIIRHEERKAKTSRTYRRRAKSALQHGIIISREGPGIGEAVFRPLTNAERDHATKASQPPSPEQLSTFWGLQSHRKFEVRGEARRSQIAYAYLRGLKYIQVEKPSNNLQKRHHNKLSLSCIEQIAKMVVKFGGDKSVNAATIDAWIMAR